MKYAIRYQSEEGNTKTLAETIASIVKVEALEIPAPIEEYTDVLFLGGGVYMLEPHKALVDYIQSLDKELVGNIVVFSSAGTINSPIERIRLEAEEVGIPVYEKNLHINVSLGGGGIVGTGGGKVGYPNLFETQVFAQDVMIHFEELEDQH